MADDVFMCGQRIVYGKVEWQWHEQTERWDFVEPSQLRMSIQSIIIVSPLRSILTKLGSSVLMETNEYM